MERAPRLAALAALVASVPPAATATVVPYGFVHEQIIGEPFVSSPVAFDFLPDGRFVLVELASGVVRIAAAGASASDPVATIPGVNANHPERGLLGVAVDPAWPARPYVYVHYTAVDSTVKVQMWEAQGALADPSSTAITLANPFLLLADIPDSAGIHNAGTLRFAPDGTLLVSVGDDALACKAQDLASPLGKLLRLDVSGMPLAGAGPPPLADLVPPGNPFPGPGWASLVAAWGLRNPFRFDVDPLTGDVYVGNVGSHLFEEIERLPAASPGLNFAWPQFENTQPLGCCGTCGQGNAFTFPIHAFPHPLGVVSVVGGPLLRRAGAVDGAFPASYHGDYFYAEIFSGRIARLAHGVSGWDYAAPVAGQPAPDAWGAGFVGASDLREGPDGSLWVLSLGLSFVDLPRGLHRIRAAAPTDASIPARPPALARVTADPNPSRAGRAVTLSVETATGHPVLVEVFDAAGRAVRRLHAAAGPGLHPVTWDGRTADGTPAPAGTYFVRMRAGTERALAKLTRLP